MTTRQDVTRWLGQIDMDATVIAELELHADEVRPILEEIARGDAGDADAYMRKNAVALLGSVGDESSVDVLVDLLDHDEPVLRANAIRSLASIGSPLAAPPLEGRLGSDELPPSEGKAIVTTLGAIGRTESAAAVERFRSRYAGAKQDSPGLERDLQRFDTILDELRSSTSD